MRAALAKMEGYLHMVGDFDKEGGAEQDFFACVP